MRKLFFLFVALLATTSLWAQTFQVGDLYYNITSSSAPYTVEVSDAVSSITTATIPESITHNGATYSVTSIGGGAFYRCSSLTSITIPNSVTSIGGHAFRDCSSLTSVTIPNSVTSIGDEAFYNCSSLTTPVYNAHCFAYMPTSFKGAYVIPEGIKQIAGRAFYDCESLTSITIPNSVTNIGYDAFGDCSSLTTPVYNAHCFAYMPTSFKGAYVIPEGIKQIAGRAFYDCESLTSITIPNSVTSIGDGAFSGCSSLTSITIGNSVTSIGGSAFYNCRSLTSVTIPNSVTSIGGHAFSGCYSLTSVTIGNSVTSIGEDAFYDCRSLTSITIPNSVTSIGDYAFRYCSSLVSMVVESGNTKYDSRDNCNAIIETATNILIAGCQNTIIPNSVTSIGDAAFDGCSSLTSIVIPNSVTTIGRYTFCGCSSLTSINIPNSVTSIGDYAFFECKTLTSITIPNSVTSIGDRAFVGCSSLTSITIPNSVTTIGRYTFGSCSSLTSVTIGNSVTSIGEEAFYNCTSLTFITCLGTTPPTLGTDVFYDTKLSAVYIPDNTLSAYQTAWGNEYTFVHNENTLTLHVETPGTLEDLIFDAGTRPALVAKLTLTGTLNDADFTCMRETMTSLIDVDLSGITNTSGVNFKGKKNLLRIILPTNLTSIEASAFSSCSSLTSITIPNSVTSIGNGAFSGCSDLTSITIPNSVTSIGDWAFSNCDGLTSITIPNSVTSIGNKAFSDCSSLTSVTIGNSVTSIGDRAFYYCRSLTSVTIPNSVTSIGEEAFYNCDDLTSVTIPNSVTSIGNNAFYNCRSLTSVTIPNSVTSIGDGAFSGCSDLTSVTIGNSVTSIGGGAFRYCSSLTSITCLGITPPEASDLGANTSTCKLIVPHSAYNAYVRHAYWGQFLNIYTGYLVTLQANNDQWGEVTGDGLYTNDTTITITATPYEGYTFLRWSDGNTDNPRVLELTQDTVLTAEFATIAGQCGDNLYWSYNESDQTISITGSGKMYDYTASTQPWLLFKEEIKEVTIANTATSIGTSAFEGCIRLGKISLGTGLKNIAADAFAGCTRLYDIYVYATYPPFADESSFANYNVYLYVPCENQRDYILDIVWGKFKFIECLSADEVEDTEDVEIDAGSTDVTITWPTEDGADTYTIVIKKDGEVVCTLTFNSEGQLISIAFAPGRDGNHPAQYAEAVANGGYRFTVTGLEEGTHYTYNIDVKNTANQTINSHTGAFTTQSTTAVDNITTNNANIQKIMRDGRLIIVRDGVEYNAMGQEM